MTASSSPVSATPWLTLSIRLMAGGFLLFFGLALATLLLRLDQSLLDSDAGRLLLRLVRWGDQQGGGQHYELMISTIYLVWGAFLWRAASQPFRHRLFIDFTVAANAAHFGLMFLQGLLMPGEHIHLAGDVLLGWASLLPLMLFWIPQRKRAALRSPSSGGDDSGTAPKGA